MHNDQPTIPAEEFAERRARLMAAMGQDSIAILYGATEQARNSDVHYPFRQDSDFLYLTGFNEPDAVTVLVPGREAGEFLLFCRDRDPEREIWDGLRAGPEGVKAHYGADEAAPIDEFADGLKGLLAGREKLYYELGHSTANDQPLLKTLATLREQGRRGLKAPPQLVALSSLLHEMRLFKSDNEIALMRHAAQTSARAHGQAMRACKPERAEYQVAATLHYEFAVDDMQPAYPSIVGGGANACILHYIENNAPLRDGDMLLIDAGGEYQGYAADITRSFPVNGQFSAPQREIYELVLKSQLAAIDAVRAGNDYYAPHRATVKMLTQGLVDLGFLQGDLDKLIADEAYRDFYMHGTGHWLGLDVHDVGNYKKSGEWRNLEPGMVVTIEPGLYIRANSANVPECYWNIGIRIEDDVVVTEAGPDVLTRDVPKSVDDIEALMRG